jgi:hypothetical protein
MADIATLQIQVDTSHVEKASKVLSLLADQAKKAEFSTDGLSKKQKVLVDQLKRLEAQTTLSADEMRLYDLAVKGATQAQLQQAAASLNQQKAISGVAAVAASGRGAFRAMRGSVQQLGYQVQDIAVQLQAGTSAITVFTQQGSQIAALFGPGGAVFGAVLAIAGAITGALIGSLRASTEELKNMTDEVDRLIKKSAQLSEEQRLSEAYKLRDKFNESLNREREARSKLYGIEKKIAEQKRAGIAISAEDERARIDAIAAMQSEQDLQDDLERGYFFLKEGRTLLTDEQERAIQKGTRYIEKLQQEAEAAGKSAIEVRRLRFEQMELAKTFGPLVAAQAEANLLKIEQAEAEEAMAKEAIDREKRKQRAILDAQKEAENQRKQFEKDKLEDQRIVNQGLLSLEDNLLKNKTDKQKAGYRLAVNLLDQEKRERAVNIVSTSYEAAMKAYAALAGVPIIGPALGAAAAATVIAAGVSFAAQSLAGRALGGQVRAGESYVVGERGPEILTMGTSGRVTPNDKIQTSQTEVSKNVNVSFQISTVDATGFDTLLQSRRGQIIGIINTALNERGRPALA